MNAPNRMDQYYGSTIRYNLSDHGWDVELLNGFTYIFADTGPIDAIRDRSGNQLTFTRDRGLYGKTTQITSPNGFWVALRYGPYNEVVEARDNAGRTVHHSYNSSGMLVKAVDPANRKTEYDYDAPGNMTAITDGRGIRYVEK